MKKLLKWAGIAFVGVVVIGIIVDANKSPEQKVAEAAVREQERSKQAEEDKKREEVRQQESIQASVPKCNDRNAVATLKQAFDQSQFARTMNLSAIEASGLQEKRFNLDTKSRECSGVITMNNTKKANVNINIAGRGNSQFMLTFEVVNVN